jgi:hypothetical protein
LPPSPRLTGEQRITCSSAFTPVSGSTAPKSAAMSIDLAQMRGGSRPRRLEFDVARESQDRPRSQRSKLLYDTSAETPAQRVG